VDIKTGRAVSMDVTSEKVGDGRRLRRLVRDAEGQEGPRRRSLRLEGELRLRRGGGDKAGHRGQERLRAEERGSQARKQAVIE